MSGGLEQAFRNAVEQNSDRHRLKVKKSRNAEAAPASPGARSAAQPGKRAFRNTNKVLVSTTPESASAIEEQGPSVSPPVPSIAPAAAISPKAAPKLSVLPPSPSKKPAAVLSLSLAMAPPAVHSPKPFVSSAPRTPATPPRSAPHVKPPATSDVLRAHRVFQCFQNALQRHAEQHSDDAALAAVRGRLQLALLQHVPEGTMSQLDTSLTQHMRAEDIDFLQSNLDGLQAIDMCKHITWLLDNTPALPAEPSCPPQLPPPPPPPPPSPPSSAPQMLHSTASSPPQGRPQLMSPAHPSPTKPPPTPGAAAVGTLFQIDDDDDDE